MSGASKTVVLNLFADTSSFKTRFSPEGRPGPLLFNAISIGLRNAFWK